MDWCKLGSGYYRDRAILRAGEAAEVLFTRALAYCAEHETDGHVPVEVLPLLTPTTYDDRAQCLVREGLWLTTDDGFEVRSWSVWQQDLDAAAERRRADRDRKRRSRDRARDGSYDVYRLYDADDVLLYVGVTCDLRSRMREHSMTQWFAQVAYCTIQHAESVEEAISLERDAIAAEKPERNVSKGNLTPAGWAGRSRDGDRDREATLSRDPVTPVTPPEKSREEKKKEPPTPSQARGRRTSKTPCPDIFPITEGMRKFVADRNIPADVARIELQRFLDHHRSLDSRFSDWEAAWRKWMGKVALDQAHRVKSSEDEPEVRGVGGILLDSSML